MSVASRFNGFLANIEPTPTQKTTAKERHEKVRTYLEGQYAGSSSFLIGSYRKNTLVRPTTDIDVMFVLSATDRTRVDKWSGNKQSQLLQEVKNKLLAKYGSTTMKADGPVVVVQFSDYKVEIAPCFKHWNSGYEICMTGGGGTWKRDDPGAQMDALSASNKATDGNTVPLVKILKVWRRECNVPLKSLALEILAMNFLSSYAYASSSTGMYDWFVRDFFKALKGSANGYVTVAGTGEYLYLGSAWQTKAESAYNRAVKATQYEFDSKPDLALEQWRLIFGGDFPN